MGIFEICEGKEKYIVYPRQRHPRVYVYRFEILTNDEEIGLCYF